MSHLKTKIVKQLDNLPDNTLQQVSDFIEFLTWRRSAGDQVSDREDIAWLENDLSNLGECEPYEWKTGEIEKGLPIDFDPEQGVLVTEELQIAL